MDERPTGPVDYKEVLSHDLHEWVTKLEIALTREEDVPMQQRGTWLQRLHRLWGSGYGAVDWSRLSTKEMVDMLANDFLGPGQRELPPWMTTTYHEQVKAMETSLGVVVGGDNINARSRMVWLELTAVVNCDDEPGPEHPCALIAQEAANKFGIWDCSRKKFTDASRVAPTTAAVTVLESLEEGEATWDRPDEDFTFRARVNWLWSENFRHEPLRAECPLLQILSIMERDKKGHHFHVSTTKHTLSFEEAALLQSKPHKRSHK